MTSMLKDADMRRPRTTFRRRARYIGLPSDDVGGLKLHGRRRKTT